MSLETDVQQNYPHRREVVGYQFTPETFAQVVCARYGIVLGDFTVMEGGLLQSEYTALKRADLHKYFGVLPTDLHGIDIRLLSDFHTPITSDRTLETLRRELLSHPLHQRARIHSIQSRLAAIVFMTQKGIRFQTIYDLPDKRDVATPRMPSPFGDCLEWQKPEFVATSSDYAEYERRAYEVLSCPRGRAAILHGGLIWRIALEILGSEVFERAVKGPSEDVFQYGQKFVPLRGDALYDDCLSTSELDIICGVYKVKHVHCTDDEPELRSWWPRPYSYDASGLAFGYWTPWCESWFQRRLESIRLGTASTRNARDWRTAIKFSVKVVAPLRDAVSTASENFLQRDLQVKIVS